MSPRSSCRFDTRFTRPSPALPWPEAVPILNGTWSACGSQLIVSDAAGQIHFYGQSAPDDYARSDSAHSMLFIHCLQTAMTWLSWSCSKSDVSCSSHDALSRAYNIFNSCPPSLRSHPSAGLGTTNSSMRTRFALASGTWWSAGNINLSEAGRNLYCESSARLTQQLHLFTEVYAVVPNTIQSRTPSWVRS